MRLSRQSILLISIGMILVLLSVIGVNRWGGNQPSNQSQSTSTTSVDNTGRNHATTVPGKDVIFQSDYSVALSTYQHYKSSEYVGADYVTRVHRITVQRDPTRTWAKVNAIWAGANGGPAIIHMVDGRIVWVYEGGSAGWHCPAPKAVCDSLESAHLTEYLVNHVGNTVVLQKPVEATISVSYLVWGSSCSDIGTLEGAFFLDPQFRETHGWDQTLTSEDGQEQTDQGATVPTCTLAFPGTLDYLPSESSSLKVCIRTSNGYLGADATFDHSISSSRVEYSHVNFEPTESGGLSYAQSCGGFSA